MSLCLGFLRRKDYVMTRPVRGTLNPTATDHVTDAYDTIDWLVKNTPESNGRVGMIGSSYEGFTVVIRRRVAELDAR